MEMDNRYTIIIAAIGVIIIAVLSIHSFDSGKRNMSRDSGRMKVETSFYPLYYFSLRVAGGKADVSNLTPAGAEPHEYELTPEDMKLITESDILVINGGGLEVWSKDIAQNMNSSTDMIVAGDGLFEKGSEGSGGNSLDPHIWLSPDMSIRIVDRITEAFAKKDPPNAEYYTENAMRLKNDLKQLDREYRIGTENCALRDIITSHAAFHYLAEAYGLKQISISGLSPEEEPSARKMASITDYARKAGARYIFYENQGSPLLSQTISEEIGAQTLVLNPLEGLIERDIAAGKDYFTEMRNNLDALRLALGCS
jgi:zinc transport system substrate-binding protein